MNRRAWYVLGVAALLGSGCGGRGGPGDGPAQSVAEVSAPSPEFQRSLAELLDRPRAELAALADEWAERVHHQQALYHEGQLRFELTPDLRLPLAVPVWRQAKYSAAAGVSLPPYLAEGAHDSGLALHLARFGDAEAARALGEPGDAVTLARIDALRLGRNYPAEWTRLAGLMLHHAEFRLAAGEGAVGEAAQDLLRLHREVRQALDSRARAGALGAALLPRGRDVLCRVAAAWKAGDHADLGKQAQEALAGWGEVPAPEPGLAPGTPREAVARLLGGTARGHALAAAPLRGLDVLSLPVPDVGVEAVVACFDARGRLAEVLVAYGPGVRDDYPQPAQLAHGLEEQAAGEAVPGGLPRRRYRLAGGFLCDALVPPGSRYAGGIVTLAGAEAEGIALPRDLGLVHLNRSFGENRLRLDPRQGGTRLTVRDAKVLAGLGLPVPAADRADVVVQREARADVIAGLTVDYTPRLRHRSLTEVAVPLWQAFGPAALRQDDQGGKALALVWEDARTHYVLRLPSADDATPDLRISDRANPRDAAELGRRAARARAWDRAERRTRLRGRRPLTRLARELEQVKLGQTRSQILAGLPADDSVLKRDLPGGLLVTFVGAPAETGKTLRELFVRFDGRRQAAEVRVHYAGPPPAGRKLLDGFQALYGAPDAEAAAGKALGWQDDLTHLTCRPESAGLDVILRDRPPADEGGPPAAAAYLPRGPEGCTLGTSLEEVVRTWGLGGQAEESPLVLTPKEGGPHDAILVWLKGGRAVRVVARHAQADGTSLTPAEAGKAVAEAWGREAAVLGWPRRQEAKGGVDRSWANHDDRTRVRVFWQQNAGESRRLYTEWQAWDGR
jgi:hypothetical protein